MSYLKLINIILFLFIYSLSHAGLEKYNIDTSHSSVEFSVRHFVAKTNGNFSDFNGIIIYDKDNLKKCYVEASIDIKSIDTNNNKRDSHLQEDDYFNSTKNPLISYKSNFWEKTNNLNVFLIHGELTMNNITKPVILKTELLGEAKKPNGDYLSGWEATSKINRTDWEINGGIGAVGEDVDIKINIEAIREN